MKGMETADIPMNKSIAGAIFLSLRILVPDRAAMIAPVIISPRNAKAKGCRTRITPNDSIIAKTRNATKNIPVSIRIVIFGPLYMF
jgi:hypothetical protein